MKAQSVSFWQGGHSMREVYTVRDVAQRLHLTTETVRDYLQEGKLKGFKVGKQWRVGEQDLEAFIEAL